MPYVNPEVRDDCRSLVDMLCSYVFDRSVSTGTLNYLVTSLLDAYLGDSPRYSDFNAAVGVLECAKLELYRRRTAPYEDGKRAENGDVYSGQLPLGGGEDYTSCDRS